MTTQRFAYRLAPRSWPVLRLFGVAGPADAWVDLDDLTLTARFGWGTATTPVANIARWRIEGPWRWITAIGIRRSIRHQDLTFGGSPHGGADPEAAWSAARSNNMICLRPISWSMRRERRRSASC